MRANGKQSRKAYHQRNAKRSQLENEEIEALERLIADGAPPKGVNLLANKSSETSQTYASARNFEELPISQATKDALKDCKYTRLTAIQRAALPHALCGRDVLGAAKTGSGKTLAFLIPVIEALYRKKWGHLDGLGALIISPTRELALQIFEELRKVGKLHEFSAGLLIGGKDVGEEAVRVGRMNILVATPGRLLQHMDETPDFDASMLQILILDEADRILDMGFSSTVNAIIENLPIERQTLLFSATQTKSVSSLARLSLQDPEYVAVHAEAETPTPVKLDQAFMECPLPDKMDILWSFVKTHLKCRVIVFLSTCKQVRFVYEAFRRLRPGTPLRALHGKMSQYKRMGVYTQFCDSKAGVLFATDIAARGLDFPAVDWVVQADCPEDVATYIHRVGRTARYTSAGRSLLLLLPSERDAMLEHLREGKIELKSLKHNPSKVQPVTPALQALLSKDSELKEIAQRALVSYVRSVFLQPNKNIFDVSKLPIEEFALSFGMTTIPKLRFLQRDGRAKLQKQASHSVQPPVEVDNVEHRDLSVLQKDNRELETGEEEIDDEGDDFLVVKRKNILEEGDAGEEEAGQQLLNMDALLSNPKKRPKKLKINVKSAKGSGTRVVFDDDGKTVDPLSLVTVEDSSADGVVEHESVEERIAAARLIMAKRDEEDKANIRLLRKLKRDERRAKRLARERGDQMDAVAVLAGAGEEGDDDYNGGSDDGDALDTGAYGSGEGEIAHKGMATLLGSGVPGNAISRHLPTSLDEQEALALHLLRGGVGN